MVTQSEQLFETVLDLEGSRQREREIRMESKALLEGLRAMGEAHSRSKLFQAIVSSLRNVIDFKQAFILQADDQKKMTVLATTLDTLKNSTWTEGSMFKTVLTGKPVAVFDISLVPEWQNMSAYATKKIPSALHIDLKESTLQAILVVTHSEPKHFGPAHVKKAHRFSPLATQALLTLELRKALRERDRVYQLSIDAMVIFTSQGEIIQHNQGWVSTFGENNQDYGNMFSLLHPKEAEHFHASVVSLHNQKGKCLLRIRLHIKAGDYNWFSCSIAIYSDQMMYYIVARDSTKDAETVAQRINKKCATPYNLKGHSIRASTCIGIAVSASDFKNEEAMLHAADLAMYKAKQNKTFLYSPGIISPLMK